MDSDPKLSKDDPPSGEAAPILSNFARLGQHLKADSLAAKLAAAWEADAPGAPHQRLFTAVTAHHAPKEKADGEGAA